MLKVGQRWRYTDRDFDFIAEIMSLTPQRRVIVVQNFRGTAKVGTPYYGSLDEQHEYFECNRSWDYYPLIGQDVPQ